MLEKSGLWGVRIQGPRHGRLRGEAALMVKKLQLFLTCASDRSLRFHKALFCFQPCNLTSNVPNESPCPSCLLCSDTVSENLGWAVGQPVFIFNLIDPRIYSGQQKSSSGQAAGDDFCFVLCFQNIFYLLLDNFTLIQCILITSP